MPGTRAPWGRSGDDLYMLYTGGTTGMPKGVMWRQDDLFARLIDGGVRHYDVNGGLEGVRDALSASPGGATLMPACPLMHGTGAFTAYTVLAEGGRVVPPRVQEVRPGRAPRHGRARKVNGLVIVGDPFSRPLLAALDADPGRWDLSSLMMVISSGAMWSEPVKQELLAHHPGMLLVDAFSSSEALGMGVSVSGGGSAAKTASFTLGPDVKVLTEDGRRGRARLRRSGCARAGRAQSPRATTRTRRSPTRTFKEIDGVRYSIPGDYAQVDADGTIHLLGRGSVCINSGGEKIFPEEVEEALKTHASVRDAVVVGIPHPTYGEQIIAVVELIDGIRPVRSSVPEAELIEHVKEPVGLTTRRRGGCGRVDDRAGAQRQGRLQAAPGRIDGGAGERRRRVDGLGTCLPRLTDVRRPGRRHAGRAGVATFRGGPSVRAPGRPGRARPRRSRWWCRRSSCWRATTVWLHLVRANPVFGALSEDPRVVLSVADDWAFVPSEWKAIGTEDPGLGIPTTYYGAVQLLGQAHVHDERTAPGGVAEILRRQLSTFQPEVPVADPAEAHTAKLLGHPRDRDPGVAGPRQVQVRRERGRRASAGGGGAVERRGAPGDEAAAEHVLRRLEAERVGVKGALLAALARLSSVCRHLLLGGTHAVITHDAGERGEPRLALVDPGLGHPAAPFGVLELVAPVGHLEGS